MSQLLNSLAQWGRQTGQYWADDNAQFEATNPGMLSRVLRNVNPMTGFGSALGQMHVAAGEGDKTQMLLAALQAIPAFAVARSAKGIAGPIISGDATGTLKRAVTPAVVQADIDAIQSLFRK